MSVLKNTQQTKKAPFSNIFSNNCANFQHLLGLFNLSDNNVNTKVFQLNTVRENTRVIDTDSNWNILLFKEACYIKNKGALLNKGLKASHELLLFK